jgi:hypothetical protein
MSMLIAEDKESKVTKEKLREVLREFELDDDVSKVTCRVLVAGKRAIYVSRISSCGGGGGSSSSSTTTTTTTTTSKSSSSSSGSGSGM